MIVNILFYCVLAANIGCVLLKKKSKILTVLSVVLAIYIGFANTGSGDYSAYHTVYDFDLRYGEIGYMILMKVSNFIGLSFGKLQGVICALSLGIILYVFRQYSDNYQLFFSLFFL